MRLNQKRALFCLVAPTTAFIIFGAWFFATGLFLGSLSQSRPELLSLSRVNEIAEVLAMPLAAFGMFFIPIGLIAALVFWWLDRQEAKS